MYAHVSVLRKIMKMYVFKSGPVLRQYAIVIIANLTFFQFGVTVGWISPAVVKLRDEHQTILPHALTETESAWVMSLSSLVALTAFSYVSFIANNLGRKYSMLIAVLPRIVNSFLLLFASKVWMLYLGRAFCGLSDFSVISIVTMYSSEIASKEIRGGLGSISQIWSAIGSMLLLSIGPFVSYTTINIIQTSVILVTFIPLLFLPESPYFLYSKGKIDVAMKTLTYLRGDVTLARDELKEYASNKTEKITLKEFLGNKIIIKSLGMVLFLAVSSQMTGYNVVTVYLQTIFESTGTNVPSEISSVIIGCIQVFACICTILLTDRFGRKPVMTSTLIILAVGMVGLGAFFKILDDGEEITGFLNYLPLISMMLVIFCYNAGVLCWIPTYGTNRVPDILRKHKCVSEGYWHRLPGFIVFEYWSQSNYWANANLVGIGALLWTLMAELFDGPSRAFGMTAGTVISTTFAFLSIRYFTSVANAIGTSAVYWIFASCCLICCLFIGFVVPETKGKAFSEIQRELGRK